MAVVFALKNPNKIPIDVREISPESISQKSIQEIAGIKIQNGNQIVPIESCFEIEGSSEEFDIVWRGNLSSVHSIGREMKSGRMLVQGDAGDFMGAGMSGGEIEVRGNSGHGVGMAMSGGLLRVLGNVGDEVGAHMPGHSRGMTGGEILIEGNAERNAGSRMRRGLISISGDVGDFAGFNMLAGTILIQGRCGRHLGAEMKRGTICCLGEVVEKESIPESFRRGNLVSSVALRLVFQRLARLNLELGKSALLDRLRIFHGDAFHGFRGEIFLRSNSN